jgi:hypothetical protein
MNLRDVLVQFEIFFNMDDIECLARGVSDMSTVNELIFRGLRLRQLSGATGQDVLVLCSENEARELLLHAQAQCDQSVEKILRAFEIAGATP